ncbi:MAG: hypothetical protein ACXVCE_03090 [Bacteriovorax sp.]
MITSREALSLNFEVAIDAFGSSPVSVGWHVDGGNNHIKNESFITVLWLLST